MQLDRGPPYGSVGSNRERHRPLPDAANEIRILPTEASLLCPSGMISPTHLRSQAVLEVSNVASKQLTPAWYIGPCHLHCTHSQCNACHRCVCVCRYSIEHACFIYRIMTLSAAFTFCQEYNALLRFTFLISRVSLWHRGQCAS